MKPKTISRPKPFLLFAEWNDGFSATISLETLRKCCPCAYCSGETIGNRIVISPQPVPNEPGAFDLKSLNFVGNYAISAAWASGHDTGIYTWEQFREIFEKYNLSDEEVKAAESSYEKTKKKIQLKVM